MSLFITCPVHSVERATAFYTALGWTLNAEMSDHNVSCFAIAPEQYLDRRVLALDAGRGSTIVVTGRVDARSSRDLVNAFGEGDVIVLATQLPESVRTTLAEAGWRA